MKTTAIRIGEKYLVAPIGISSGMPFASLSLARAEFPLLATHSLLNNCSQGPQSHATRLAADRFLDSWRNDGMDWEAWIGEVNRAREAFARLINADLDEIAVTSSVSEAVSSLASALDFRDRPGLVLAESEFPTVAHGWQAQARRGADLEWASDGDLGRLVNERTRLVSVTHASYLTGAKQDVAAIAATAHRHGALVFTDVYQTIGTCPIDVRALDVDFLAAGCLKYLLGTAGIAFLYVRRSLIERLVPTVTGWFGRQEPLAFRPRPLDWADTAARFDTGTPPLINAAIARAGIELIEAADPAAIDGWIQNLSARMRARALGRNLTVLSPAAPAAKAPTTAIEVGDQAGLVEGRLRRRRILASARGNVIRLAPHFFTTEAEIDQAIDALAEEIPG